MQVIFVLWHLMGLCEIQQVGLDEPLVGSRSALYMTLCTCAGVDLTNIKLPWYKACNSEALY